MGFRTLVLFYNDEQHNWSKDPNLGSIIAQGASSSPIGEHGHRLASGYGTILEVTHADTQRLAVIDSYSMTTLALGHWSGSGEMQKLRDLALVKQAAERLGYKLVKA